MDPQSLAGQSDQRHTLDLCERIDNIAENKMLSRGGWMRNTILEKVREIENQSRPHNQQQIA
jgi:hypothetical protein